MPRRGCQREKAPPSQQESGSTEKNNGQASPGVGRPQALSEPLVLLPEWGSIHLALTSNQKLNGMERNCRNKLSLSSVSVPHSSKSRSLWLSRPFGDSLALATQRVAHGPETSAVPVSLSERPTLGPTSDLLNHNLPFNKIPR